MLPKCQDNTKTSVLQTTLQHINQFAGEGLRTLAVAVKPLTLEDYQEFAQSLDMAKQSLHVSLFLLKCTEILLSF